MATNEQRKRQQEREARRNKKRNGNDLNKLGQDINKSREIAETVLPLDPLSRIDASRSTETQNLLNQLSSLSDPTSASYVGNRSSEISDYVNRLKNSTQGYDSNELNALREQRLSGMRQNFQSGRAALMRGQGNAGVGTTQRGAQLADLARNFGLQTSAAENDLFVKGADEKQRRLTEYGNTIQGITGQEFNRSQAALNAYREALGGAQADELGRQKINLGQEASDRAARSGGILGVLGIAESRRNARAQNQIARQSLKRGTGGAATAQGTAANPYADALDSLIKSMYPQAST